MVSVRTRIVDTLAEHPTNLLAPDEDVVDPLNCRSLLLLIQVGVQRICDCEGCDLRCVERAALESNHKRHVAVAFWWTHPSISVLTSSMGLLV